MLGTDIVEVKRIKRLLHRQSFLDKVFTSAEIEILQSKPAESWAGVWAAKEAVAKALGSGFGEGVFAKSIEITKTSHGQPQVTLVGCALEKLKQLGFNDIRLSISHTKSTAIAVAILIAI